MDPSRDAPSVVAARVLLDELARLGVRDLVLCPGSRSAPLAYAAHDLDAAGRLRLHVRVDERSAAFLALGLGKRSRRPALVVTTSGSAVANLHPAVLEAHHAAVPLILLTADRPPELRGVGANQATTQPGIFGGAVRLTLDLETPADPTRQALTWRTAAARAVAAATGSLAGAGSAGPVHVDLPLRDPLVPGLGDDGDEGGTAAPSPDPTDPTDDPLLGRPGDRPWVELPSPPPVLDPATGTRLVADGSTLLVVGELPTPQHRAAALAWAEHVGAPVVAEPGPGSTPFVLPHGALLLTATDWVADHAPRRVVVAGRPTTGRAVPALLRRPGLRVEVVDAGERGADVWADATHAAAAVHPFAVLGIDGPSTPPSTWARTWLDAGERVAARLAAAGQPTAPLDGPAVAATLLEAVPGGARVLVGSSSVARDVHLGVARPREDVDLVTSRGLAGIDGLVSTAAGLALADPGTPTYALLGDLTALHDGNGLLIGPDEPTPDLTVVVVDDDGGSIFATLEHGAPARAATFARLFATPTRTDVVALARAHGAAAERVTTRDDLARSLAAPPRGLRVVVVPVDLAARRSADLVRRGLAADALADPPAARS